MRLPSQYRFMILVAIVSISGFTQGMLLPLLSILLERANVPSSLNGLNASALYIGILIASPFMEKPLRKFGYKPMIITGLVIVLISISAIPVLPYFWVWFLLRFFVGIGDHMLHFATQTWITQTTPMDKMGRKLAIYGLSFGLGFAIGPLTVNMLEINKYLPFIISACATILAGIGIMTIQNEYPVVDHATSEHKSSGYRYIEVLKKGWVALLPVFAYGFLEASLNGNFPVYAMRLGMNVSSVSIILPSFVIGSLISQIPLGIISDHLGRRRVLVVLLFCGSVAFLCAAFVTSTSALLCCFIAAGMFVGSLFSMSISYMTDLLPKSFLPLGNILAGMAYSIGSMVGPTTGGAVIDVFKKGSLFYMLSIMLFFVCLMVARSVREKKQHQAKTD